MKSLGIFSNREKKDKKLSVDINFLKRFNAAVQFTRVIGSPSSTYAAVRIIIIIGQIRAAAADENRSPVTSRARSVIRFVLLRAARMDRGGNNISS